VKHLTDNADLLFELLVGIRMIGIDDRCRIGQMFLSIHRLKTDQILIVIIWITSTILVHSAAQNHMCQIVSICRYIHASVNKSMGTLCRDHRVEHHRKITTGRIFHPHRNIHTAGRQSVLLVFNRTRPDCLIR